MSGAIDSETGSYRLADQLMRRGWSLAHSDLLRRVCGVEVSEEKAKASEELKFVDAWNRLPPDLYLKDGGHYRYRRHASAIVDLRSNDIVRAPHRPHWQPTTYNALHGGIRRWFDPIEDVTWRHATMQALIAKLGLVFAQAEARPLERWYVEAHQFRIDAANEIGKPTPEGAHRDGVDFVAVVLVSRGGIAGGESAVRALDGSLLAQVTLTEPFTALLMNDRGVMHETTPIIGTAPSAHRDTLVLTYRGSGFLDPE